MSDPVRAGQPIKLRLQLDDEDLSAFPQAELADQAGADVGGTPIDLTHIGDGLYVDDSELMPAIPIVYVQYKTYEDALHTKRHPCHCEVQLDVFERDITGETVDNIDNNLSGLTGSFDFLGGSIDDNGELLGSIFDTGELAGIIENDGELVGIIEDPDTLFGTLFEGDELVGTINC